MKFATNRSAFRSSLEKYVYGFSIVLLLSGASIVEAITVTPGVLAGSGGAHGTISPNSPQTVAAGSVVVFALSADAGYSASATSSCGGALAGDSFTTAPITADCSVTAKFLPITTFSAPSATGTGMISASFTGGSGCIFDPTPEFIPVTGNPKSPPAGSAPASVTFPHGLFDFSLVNCTESPTVTMTITYPTALPPGTQYWKYGPTPGNVTPHWYVLPATISGNTVTFTIADGALGDDDLSANFEIIDQGGPGVGPVSAGTSIPTLSDWGLLLLFALLLIAAHLRNRFGSPGS